VTEALVEHAVTCPWCWEPFDVLIDVTAGDQRYIEDCAVCCHPVELAIRVDTDAAPAVEA
jgi:hypothetical protein